MTKRTKVFWYNVKSLMVSVVLIVLIVLTLS